MGRNVIMYHVKLFFLIQALKLRKKIALSKQDGCTDLWTVSGTCYICKKNKYKKKINLWKNLISSGKYYLIYVSAFSTCH